MIQSIQAGRSDSGKARAAVCTPQGKSTLYGLVFTSEGKRKEHSFFINSDTATSASLESPTPSQLLGYDAGRSSHSHQSTMLQNSYTSFVFVLSFCSCDKVYIIQQVTICIESWVLKTYKNLKSYVSLLNSLKFLTAFSIWQIIVIFWIYTFKFCLTVFYLWCAIQKYVIY